MLIVLLTLRGLLGSSPVSFTHLVAWMTGESEHTVGFRFEWITFGNTDELSAILGLSTEEAAGYKAKPAAAVLVGLYLFFSIVISNLFSSEMRASLTVQEGSPKIQEYADLIGSFKETRILVWRFARPEHILQVRTSDCQEL